MFNHFGVFSVFTQKTFSPIKHNILIHSQKTYILLTWSKPNSRIHTLVARNRSKFSILSSDLLHFSAATGSVKSALVMNSYSKNAPSRSVTTCFTAVISNAHWLSPASSQIATCRVSVGVVHLKWRSALAFRERTEIGLTFSWINVNNLNSDLYLIHNYYNTAREDCDCNTSSCKQLSVM